MSVATMENNINITKMIDKNTLNTQTNKKQKKEITTSNKNKYKGRGKSYFQKLISKCYHIILLKMFQKK